MKWIKLVTFALLAANFLGWLLIGRPDSLRAACQHFRHEGSTPVDTLHVFVFPLDTEWYYRDMSDISQKRRIEALNSLPPVVNTFQVHEGSIAANREALPEYLSPANAVFDVRALDIVPFLLVSEMGILMGDGSSTYRVSAR